MLFFQLGLLLGYGYAHALCKYLSIRRQVGIHWALLGISLLWLPIVPNYSIKSDPTASPEWLIIVLLISSIGPPYVLLSSTGPLLQHWFAQRLPQRSPYRLYSIANLGSILGLMMYPFLIEPYWGLTTQIYMWSTGYCIATLICIATGWSFYRSRQHSLQGRRPDAAEKPLGSSKPVQDSSANSLLILDPLLWMSLAACGAILLLAATNFICQEVAVVPFIWIVPLCLYLATFTITFENPRWYARWFWLPALILVIQPVFDQLEGHYDFESGDMVKESVIYLAAMFIAVMVCHGELTRVKPPAQRLTLFYLMIALGGALGGTFVNLVAPKIFSDYWEWPYGFMLCIMLAGLSYCRCPGFAAQRSENSRVKGFHLRVATGISFVMILFLGQCFFLGLKVAEFQQDFTENVLDHHRNFFGVLRVAEEGVKTSRHRKELLHGNIDHGTQLQSPEGRQVATTYYSTHSGIGLSIDRHPLRLAGRPLKIGVIGLGTGTLATYLRPDDRMVFYEIDPDVARLANKHFSFLRPKYHQVKIVLGDARISLRREINAGKYRNFDVLAVDAFRGDAIPVHLLTMEAFTLYLAHLNKGGILAVHISNKHFDLKPLVFHTAKKFGFKAILITNEKKRKHAIRAAKWVLVTKNIDFGKDRTVLKKMEIWDDDVKQNPIIWTDDYSNLIRLLDE